MTLLKMSFRKLKKNFTDFESKVFTKFASGKSSCYHWFP